MSKKNYMTPAAKFIIMKSSAIILASRAVGGGNANDIGWGGKGAAGQSADSRGGGFWDDED